MLDPGRTCWRVEHADNAAFLIDGADYLRHVKAAMLRARRRIVLIGWDFDGRTTLERGDITLPGPNQLGALLYWLLWKRPGLEIYVLKSNLRLLPLLDDLWYGLTPVAVLNRLSGRRIRFAVDGDVAGALGDVARDRWEAATGQCLQRLDVSHRGWPRGLDPDVNDVGVGIARTTPALPGRDEVREVEALNLAAIASARHTIYLENQYLASRTLAEALADRLRESDGPEIVIVLPRRSESRLEQESMDSARKLLLEELWAADEHHRLGVYWPVTDGGTPVYVHSKVVIVDDGFLRIGSSNLNNRSMGFDSECDLAIEADRDDDTVRQAIARFRNRLIGEHLGVGADGFAAALRDGTTFARAVESLTGAGRTLRRFTAETVVGEDSPLAENDLMDPDHVPRSLADSVRRFLARLGD